MLLSNIVHNLQLVPKAAFIFYLTVKLIFCAWKFSKLCISRNTLLHPSLPRALGSFWTATKGILEQKPKRNAGRISKEFTRNFLDKILGKCLNEFLQEISRVYIWIMPKQVAKVNFEKTKKGGGHIKKVQRKGQVIRKTVEGSPYEIIWRISEETVKGVPWAINGGISKLIVRSIAETNNKWISREIVPEIVIGYSLKKNTVYYKNCKKKVSKLFFQVRSESNCHKNSLSNYLRRISQQIFGKIST